MAPSSAKRSTSCCKSSSASSQPEQRSLGMEPTSNKAAKTPAFSSEAEKRATITTETASGDLNLQEWAPSADFPALNNLAGAAVSGKGANLLMSQNRSTHPLDPLSQEEVVVASETVKASGASPEIRDAMRFIEVALNEPKKEIVALADAYFFPPYQPSNRSSKAKIGAKLPLQLPPRQARLIVYNLSTNETSIWVVELTEVYCVTRGGGHRGKVISCKVIPEVQPALVRILMH